MSLRAGSSAQGRKGGKFIESAAKLISAPIVEPWKTIVAVRPTRS